ncbi:MAG TPA: GGDEF domain-containing protein, partial [Acidimicrobiales bacterium]|nr:GGDEF domain-containing protein [Acidimicrobiales bacterium]
LRPEDTIGRWGGEEFLAVLPMTDATGAGEVAERIRYSVSASPIRIPSGDYLEITTSVGYSSASGHSADADRLIREADGALYKAKNGGRNRVAAAGPSVIDQPADRLAEKGGSN